MADISKVILPNESEYDIKDTTARSQASSATATADTAMSLANAANNRASSAQSVASSAANQASSAYSLANSAAQTVNNISPDSNKNVQTTVELTQAEYDALQSPDPNVVYYITDSSTSYPDASNIRYKNGVSVADAIDGLDCSTIVQFLGAGWSTTETINSVVYHTQTISVTSVFDIHPEISIVPNSGILPTEAEQNAYTLVDYFTVDKLNNIVKGYASTAPSDTFSVIVKGVS